MEIERAAFLKALETCKPALASKDLIQELTFVFSDGETLTAFNDVIGIQVPFASEFKGGIKGALLLGMLNHSRSEKVTLELVSEEEALLKAGRLKLKLALLEATQAMYELPVHDKAKKFHVSSAFYAALRAVRLSIGNTTAAPDQLGVTIMLQGALQLYATDAKTMSWATCKISEGWPLKPGVRVIIPTTFVDELIKLWDDKTSLYITKDDVLAHTGKGVKLFARLVDSPKPSDFKGIIDSAMAGSDIFDIPTRLNLMLKRSLVMLNGQSDEAIDMAIDADTLRIFATTPHGDLKDSTKLTNPPPPISIRINPDLVKRGIAQCTRMSMNKETTLMYGHDFIYLIGNYST